MRNPKHKYYGLSKPALSLDIDFYPFYAMLQSSMNETPLHNPMKQGGSSNRSNLKTTFLVVLALVAVTSIGYSVYAWMQNRQLSNDVINKNNQIATLQKQQTPPAKTTPTPPADPYANWKTYCDTTEKACFKYPSDWTVNASNQGGVVSVSLENSAKTLIGSYRNSDTRDGFSNPYFAAAIEDLATPDTSYKVLGGFVATAATVYPEYKVVDASFTTSLTAGRQGTTEDTARFTFKDKNTGSLDIKPMGANGMTQGQAKAWFTSDDAKTADLVAKSFYLQ